MLQRCELRQTSLILLATVPLLLAGCVVPASSNQDEGTATEQNPLDEVQQSQNNQAPVADAGADQIVAPGTRATLNGTASTDADADALSFIWTQVGSPTVQLDGQFSAVARFTAPAVSAATTLVFSLTVTDGFAATIDQVQVTIQP
jgi:hypothetical protein